MKRFFGETRRARAFELATAGKPRRKIILTSALAKPSDKVRTGVRKALHARFTSGGAHARPAAFPFSRIAKERANPALLLYTTVYYKAK